jgi:hypothetical protein
MESDRCDKCDSLLHGLSQVMGGPLVIWTVKGLAMHIYGPLSSAMG